MEKYLDETLTPEERAIALTDAKCIPQKKHRQRAKNHTLFRDIVKTGTSFDDFTQESVNLIFSHVNKKHSFSQFSVISMPCS